MALLASYGVKQSIEVIRNRTKGNSFKLFGKVYAYSLIVSLPSSCGELLKGCAFAVMQSRVTWAGFCISGELYILESTWGHLGTSGLGYVGFGWLETSLGVAAFNVDCLQSEALGVEI